MGKTLTLRISRPGGSPKFVGRRGLHYLEGGRWAPPGKPAVLPPLDTRALEMTQGIQRLSFALARHFAPAIDGRKWRAMHGAAVAMNNGSQNGFDEDAQGDVVPHADFINGLDLEESLPRFDKMQRSFAGTFIRGEVVGRELWCHPGVHGIDAAQPLPDLQTVLERNWYVLACTSGDRIYNFPHGNGNPVAYLFIFDRLVRFPLEWFAPWERDYLPNHLEVYA